ncbi:single-stranded DNA-binding protein [Thermotoga sp.]|uniref:single-stranded DNA-binding protein n=1 Tax=Thermotoga sp. TaxID=28240 RepID=UPI0025E3A6D8|nr:single-stranded DNA-binding protein [Thermotoga sp.]MCD6550664.1 single-stranded DNA-binding protein [Thermotoga sp.]
MPYLNHIQLMGHIGHEPEIKFTPNGKQYRVFSLAVSRGRDREGNERGTDWFRVISWGDRPWIDEIGKGDLVFVAGRIEIDHKDEKTFVNVVASRVFRLRGKLQTSQEIETTEEPEAEYIPPEVPENDDVPF